MILIRTKELPWVDGLQRGAYSQRRKKLGGEAMTSSLWELAPGKKSFPLHAHNGTEEALFVISGAAQVRSPTELMPIGAGDFVSFPPGDAHQLINDGIEPLVYLAFSVSKGLDITEYPDSNKVHVVFGTPPNAKSLVFQQKGAVGYFEGEPDAM